MCKQALSSFNYLPEEMRAYLRNYGYSFSKRACEYAVKSMQRMNPANGKMENIEPFTREQAEEMLNKHGIKLENNVGYNFVYALNMIYSDRWKSSIEDELHLCKAVKDEIDDCDGLPESIFRCWITKQEDKGIPIPWDRLI